MCNASVSKKPWQNNNMLKGVTIQLPQEQITAFFVKEALKIRETSAYKSLNRNIKGCDLFLW